MDILTPPFLTFLCPGTHPATPARSGRWSPRETLIGLRYCSTAADGEHRFPRLMGNDHCIRLIALTAGFLPDGWTDGGEPWGHTGCQVRLDRTLESVRWVVRTENSSMWGRDIFSCLIYSALITNNTESFFTELLGHGSFGSIWKVSLVVFNMVSFSEKLIQH